MLLVLNIIRYIDFIIVKMSITLFKFYENIKIKTNCKK